MKNTVCKTLKDKSQIVCTKDITNIIQYLNKNLTDVFIKNLEYIFSGFQIITIPIYVVTKSRHKKYRHLFIISKSFFSLGCLRCVQRLCLIEGLSNSVDFYKSSIKFSEGCEFFLVLLFQKSHFRHLQKQNHKQYNILFKQVTYYLKGNWLKQYNENYCLLRIIQNQLKDFCSSENGQRKIQQPSNAVLNVLQYTVTINYAQ